jgi:leucyl aminopeptidase
MEYKGQAKNSEKLPKVGLVGKGVTFDTGGISIKPSSNMHLMKSDMGGAAAVLGTMELAAKLKLPIHLIGIIPSTENMVDGAGTKPGDVINTYLGKSIEVIDTDAEGRLILADGLAYMKKNFEPDHMIDLATLTGSVIMTLGYNAAGLFSNDDKLAEALLKAGDSTGERLWRLPLWEVYFEDIKSDVADIANLGNKPMSGAITAAKFLEFFTDKHLSWAHLDIAGVAMANNELGQSRLATAYGIRLLINFLENI